MADHLPDLDTAVSTALQAVEAALTLDELREAESSVLGKHGVFAAAKKRLASLAPEERAPAGASINAARAAVEAAIGERRAALSTGERAKLLESDRIDLTERRRPEQRGHLHLVTQTQQHLEDVFVAMGFSVEEGPLVETDWHNFQALNIPPAHPARANQDTLYLDFGAPETTLLRTHTSPVQIRTMLSKAPPIYAICPGRVYRKDTPDARHTPAFSQIEGLVVDRGITFGDLAGTIDAFTKAYFGADINARLRPAYFPFTEPSAEFEVTCAICRGDGCRTCSNTGWIELGGCGMVHPAVLRAVGIDPEEWSGFAFGFGIDRCAQVFHTISDMRVMADNDLRFIRQF
ncbi:MAG: phenylalanine--tRNA ligase subunit alpha [Actinobacteria bacterium]|nr:phenylalanine--tRNA ligase subunit alpha [Actinomycetota bacterium]